MLNCLIIGSGIAGLSTAISLRKAGHQATVYEAYQGPSDGIGGFLTVAVNGFDALQTLGLKEGTAALGFSTPQMSMYLGSTGKHLIDFDYGGSLPDGTTARTMTRSELYALLREEAGRRGVRIVYGKRLARMEQKHDAVTAFFSDGTSAEGHLVVGADGLHSAVRPLIDPESPAPRNIPLLNTGGIVQAGAIPATLVDVAVGRMKMVFGKRCFYCYMQDPEGKIWWFANPLQISKEDPAAFDAERRRSWLTGLVEGDCTPMAAIIGATTEIIRPYTTSDFPSIPLWHRGAAVLVGDAAHAASPSSGQGASMAIEDAVTLGRELQGISPSGIPAALARYEEERRDRAELVVEWGRRNAAPKIRGQFRRVAEDLVLKLVFRSLARKAADNFDWVYKHHIEWDAPEASYKADDDSAPASPAPADSPFHQ
ncbi:FAD-dependent oxidoreductase [Paenarthrobacter nitroguajacolicus]|uniref:FAD-dependent oxidoreductase n=1 Tax=Paenarthrobacter nitroguajacolicus TaxID=211146 RepID=UPI00248B696D|nr:FAD-dependent monooxygenase [Paenarthrobacter nitroguajacolicus]MDI2035976.1 FAD-dependent urate hydroxylase [Paenarthrobacter nitroguajacolicus]